MHCVFPCLGSIQNQISTLELLIEDDKQKSIQLELLQHEKVQLIAELAAKESLIYGLRTERKVWGHELAQQGKILTFQRETNPFFSRSKSACIQEGLPCPMTQGQAPPPPPGSGPSPTSWKQEVAYCTSCPLSPGWLSSCWCNWVTFLTRPAFLVLPLN